MVPGWLGVKRTQCKHAKRICGPPNRDPQKVPPRNFAKAEQLQAATDETASLSEIPTYQHIQLPAAR